MKTIIYIYFNRFVLCSYASLATSIKTSSPIDECDASELWSSLSSLILDFCWIDFWIVALLSTGDDRWCVVVVVVVLDRLCLFICDW
jgi:hypothetical protein